MQIKVRVRTNDVSDERRANQLVHDGFILYDNCSEVKYGEKQTVNLEEFKELTWQYDSLKDKAKAMRLRNKYAETNREFHDIVLMVKDIEATEKRLDETRQMNNIEIKNYYHYNAIEWTDRLTERKYRLIFDTIVFLTDDKGDTIRKIEG
jgi:hypothetical protein